MIDPQIDQECIVTSVGLVSPSCLQVVRNSLAGRLQVARTSLARRSQVARKSLATHTKSYQNQIKNPFKIVPKSIKFVSKSSEIISWAPKAPQRSATLAKIAPGTRQKLPQDLPRAPKSAPRVPQESPKIAEVGPQRPPKANRRALGDHFVASKLKKIASRRRYVARLAKEAFSEAFFVDVRLCAQVLNL